MFVQKKEKKKMQNNTGSKLGKKESKNNYSQNKMFPTLIVKILKTR